MDAAAPTPNPSLEFVLPAGDGGVEATARFFTERLGFRLVSIVPADGPREAVLERGTTRVRIDRACAGAAGRLRLGLPGGVSPADEREWTAPNGTVVELVDSEGAGDLASAPQTIAVPPLEHGVVVSRAGDGAAWHAGRAGMLYRDLVPSRFGGVLIASHIRIPGGGPVPDYVHYHAVRFQVIFCRRGAVRVVYEDQGEPFWMRAGDCVLQPPGIRHRVLESADDLEVVELGCPAEHPTFVEHAFGLPTGTVDRERRFGAQRFVRFVANDGTAVDGGVEGFTWTDTGIGEATGGAGSVRVWKAVDGGDRPSVLEAGSGVRLLFVLEGRARVRAGDEDVELGRDDSLAAAFVDGSLTLSAEHGSELLEVWLPRPDPVVG